ncbi:MAG: redox-sensing transcriptional repressor Rex [Ruminococcaceae bacterium]|nr:redox-sensing transcriptional repressor Rex [Oscillospiraceae bacterium]
MNNKQNDKKISNAVIRRLPRYFRYLRELIRNDIMRISSRELSEKMNITASQIRQDLNCFGGFGQQGYGYNVKFLYSEISHILGVENGITAIIIGIGNMGKALVNNPLFEKRGIKIMGLFDTDPDVIGTTYGDLTVMDAKDAAGFIDENFIDIAVLTIPKSAAQDTFNELAETSILGIWNFSNAEIKCPENKDIKIENVHLGDSLMALCYEVAQTKESN